MKKTLIVGAILSALSFNMFAETPSFDYVNIGYVSNIGGINKFDGFGIKGNFELNESFFINAEYQSVDSKAFGFNANGDYNRFGTRDTVIAFGIGYKKDITADSTFFTELDGVKAKVGVGDFFSSKENGYQVVVGLRSNINSKLEVKMDVNYLNLDHVDFIYRDDTLFQLGGLYKFNKSVGWYFDIDTDFSDSSYNTGIRFSF
ncbi:MAG TPA: hypothetical protein ENJ60_05265 [Aeromonadales bacterium]|nr:hypothetical protein [Aeromonadales bacterium]